MTSGRKPPIRKVFVSYSHVDRPLVTAIVAMMRTTGARVFQDIDSIPHGALWRPVIQKSLRTSHLLLLFWCYHAKSSDEVRQEWQTVIELRKDVFPARLDKTRLPPGQGPNQGSDLVSAGGNRVLQGGRSGAGQ